MSKKQIVKLKCGVEGTFSTYKGSEFLSISIINLYEGYGPLNDPKLLSELFKELDEEGWKLSGLMRQVGYYDSTSDLMIEALRNKKNGRQ